MVEFEVRGRVVEVERLRRLDLIPDRIHSHHHCGHDWSRRRRGGEADRHRYQNDFQGHWLGACDDGR
eukprot:3934828-Rhodomonas_salina.2